jgi:hypothetical protein
MTAGWASVPGWNPTRKGCGGERWWQGGREEERGREWELGEETWCPENLNLAGVDRIYVCTAISPTGVLQHHPHVSLVDSQIVLSSSNVSVDDSNLPSESPNSNQLSSDLPSDTWLSIPSL